MNYGKHWCDSVPQHLREAGAPPTVLRDCDRPASGVTHLGLRVAIITVQEIAHAITYRSTGIGPVVEHYPISAHDLLL